ncbi:MAG TPA: CYTH and CHAD domain-containing protein [Streptosporangiaceae bacterium]|nr:CYTH and CHAD domain-containing protein [Streptosporangiaceae bacterium]
MAVQARETEIKYEAAVGASLPSFDILPQVARTRSAASEQLDAEYFDTDDLRLIRAGITLRRRRGGHDAGWHLKLPAGPDTRREIRLPLGRSRGRVPDELARLVRVHTRGEELKPVARISTARRRQLLLDSAGESLAEVASDDVTAQTLGDATRVSQWHEVEVELTGGNLDVLTAADKLLRRDGLSRSGQSAKLARALGLPPPERAEQRPPGGSAPAGQVLQAYIGAQFSLLKSLDPMVRGSEPDSVHQMRTTVRRLRSTLQVFARFFADSVSDPLAAELRWLGAVLGEARDAEVLAGHLAEHVSQLPEALVVGPVMARVRGHFARIGADAQVGVVAALDSPRYFALLDQLDELMAEPPWTDLAARAASDALPAAVRTAYVKTSRRMKQALRGPAGERRDLALHRARKAAKRARYAGEAVGPAFGKQASRFARQMKRLQSVLGEHQDAVIVRQTERDLGMSAHLAGENAFSYGLMYERDDQAAVGLQRQARRTWREASQARYRRWLH